MADFIPVALPDLSALEREYVNDAMRSSWISSTGPYLDRFELEFAAMCGATDCLGVSNGTVALHLALEALGVGEGDEVIVPSLTYIATANAVRYVGATPVFVDVDPGSWCISVEEVERAITTRTVGVIAVDLYGHPADMVRLRALAADRGLWTVQDSAEAHFARCHGKTVGSVADITTFSFYGNKILTSGEGGAVVTSDTELAARMRLLRGQGMDPNRRYWFPVIGFNYRMTNVAAAILCAQLVRRDEIIARRQQVFDLYRERLGGLLGLQLQPIEPWAEPAPWLFSLLVDSDAAGLSRDDLMGELLRQDIDTRPFFVPIHRLPPYENRDGNAARVLPHTERLADMGLNLPTHSELDADMVRRISGAIEAALGTAVSA